MNTKLQNTKSCCFHCFSCSKGSLCHWSMQQGVMSRYKQGNIKNYKKHKNLYKSFEQKFLPDCVDTRKQTSANLMNPRNTKHNVILFSFFFPFSNVSLCHWSIQQEVVSRCKQDNIKNSQEVACTWREKVCQFRNRTLRASFLSIGWWLCYRV